MHAQATNARLKFNGICVFYSEELFRYILSNPNICILNRIGQSLGQELLLKFSYTSYVLSSYSFYYFVHTIFI